MNELLLQYLNSFLHPWVTQDILSGRRTHRAEALATPLLQIVDEEQPEEVYTEEKVGVNLHESLTISWLFSIFNATYIIIGMTMGLHTLELAEKGLSESVGLNAGNYLAYSIFTVLMKIVFFPLIFWFYGRFWVSIIKIFANLFEKGLEVDDLDEICEEVVANSLTGHTFLVIPILGEVLQKLSFLIYLFAGLRRNIGFNVLQSALVLLCPLILILFAFFLMFMSFALLISSL